MKSKQRIFSMALKNAPNDNQLNELLIDQNELRMFNRSNDKQLQRYLKRKISPLKHMEWKPTDYSSVKRKREIVQRSRCFSFEYHFM